MKIWQLIAEEERIVIHAFYVVSFYLYICVSVFAYLSKELKKKNHLHNMTAYV